MALVKTLRLHYCFLLCYVCTKCNRRQNYGCRRCISSGGSISMEPIATVSSNTNLCNMFVHTWLDTFPLIPQCTDLQHQGVIQLLLHFLTFTYKLRLSRYLSFFMTTLTFQTLMYRSVPPDTIWSVMSEGTLLLETATTLSSRVTSPT